MATKGYAIKDSATGYMQAADMPILTGDVGNGTGGTLTTTIADGVVSYAKMQDVSATDKVLGRSTAGSGDVEEIACTAAGRALLDDADASAQRTTLGLGTIATQASDSVSITGGSITGITDLAIADGGTAASTAAGARVNLLPSLSGNAGKVLAANGGETDVEWVAAATAPSQGSDVASANDLTLGAGTAFEITGTTQINALTVTGLSNGYKVDLLFTSTPTVKHNTAGGAGTAVVLLAGSADAVMTAGSRLQLLLCEIGGTQAWRETARTFV